MVGYALRRLAMLVPVLLGVTVIVFLTMALVPGDPALAILGPYATPETTAELRTALGLDRPLAERYLIWLGNLLEGDLGRSYRLDRPVVEAILDRLGPTLLLAGAAFVLATAFGLAAGAVAAARQYGWSDRLLTVAALVGISTPNFWLGLVLMLIFAVQLGWLPVSGLYPVWGEPTVGTVAAHLVLPAVTLAAVAAGVIARVTRTQMLEVLRQDYVRAARARGLGERRVLGVHALRAALGPVVPVAAVQAGFVIGGSVYVETVFQWPGIGRMLVNAISTRDILLVQGGVLLVAASYVAFNLVADVLQHAIDPRVKA